MFKNETSLFDSLKLHKHDVNIPQNFTLQKL